MVGSGNIDDDVQVQFGLWYCHSNWNTSSGIYNSMIRFHRGPTSSGGFMSFTTDNNSERMRITATGNVGIGTGSPEEKLHIHNSSTSWGVYSTIRLSSDTVSYSGSEIAYYRGTSNATAGLVLSGTKVDTRKDITILNESGNVGIGTTSPSVKLHLYSKTSSAMGLLRETILEVIH